MHTLIHISHTKSDKNYIMTELKKLTLNIYNLDEGIYTTK